MNGHSHHWSLDEDSHHYDVLSIKYESLDPVYGQGIKPKSLSLKEDSRFLRP
jgi:hypothetical protein